ncbi:hypothetical protein FRB96_007378 [Tulasnella sp. 330]|nr:hypothetical protein FRB96_007378 [Tulasnella sp. 330]
MIARLNTNLDVLLIFAGLFSAVNTAFIVVALATLSANPADETNHLLRLLVMNVSNYTLAESDLIPPFTPGQGAVRQNCTFFASLCCSLLAATGAVLAKQWLQAYERTGQTGPIEEQVIRRTEKFVGAENWGLRQVVEGLATLLLVSLTLFFIALVDYLWTVNRTVALVVSAFAALGTFLYILMVVAAASCSTCPFQTGPSAALRWPYFAFQRIIYSTDGDNSRMPFRHTIYRINSWIFGRSGANLPLRLIVGIPTMFLECAYLIILVVGVMVVATLRLLIPPKRDITESQVGQVQARSLILMAESAPHLDGLLMIAENAQLVSDFKGVRLMASSITMQSLLFQLRKSLLSTGSGTPPAHTATWTRAIAHLSMSEPRRAAAAAKRFFPEWESLVASSSRLASIELVLLLDGVQNLHELSLDRYTDYYNTPVLENKCLRPSAAKLALHKALRHNVQSEPEAFVLQSAHHHSATMFWLRHCIITAAYNRWDKDHMTALIGDISDVFLFGGLKVDAAYLNKMLDALTHILEWYSVWGHQLRGDDSGDGIKTTWDAVPGSSPIADQIIDALVAFSRHYELTDSHTFPTVLRCQTQLLVHINALYPTFDALLQGPQSPSPELSLVGRMHSSLNSNIEHLLRIDSLNRLGESAKDRETARTCEEELVKTLRRLLLTSITPRDESTRALADTGRLALRITRSEDQERLLQGILYGFFVKIRGQSLDDDGTRHDILRHSSITGLALASAMRQYLWLFPNVSPDQAWLTFQSALPRMADETAADHPILPVAVPETWDSAITIARGGDPLQYDCMGPYMMLLGTGLQTHAQGEIDEGRLVSWFAQFMQRSCMVKTDDLVSAETREYWSVVDRKCAGVLLLEAWGATLGANDVASAEWPSIWTTSDAIEAFAAWLRVYDGQEIIEITLGHVVHKQIPVPHDLVPRFIKQAGIVNGHAVEQFKLQETFEAVGRANRSQEDPTLHSALVDELVNDAISNAGQEDCEWCTGRTSCTHRIVAL